MLNRVTPRISHFATLLTGSCLASVLTLASSLMGQDFKIASSIYTADSHLPVSENLTLFGDNLIFDFSLSNDLNPQVIEVVIFDSAKKQFVLLDYSRQVKAEVSDLQVIKLIDGLTKETMQNESSAFLVKDEFEEELDEQANQITMTSPNIIYRATGRTPDNYAILPKYYEFLENFTKLTVTDPHKLPPFPRLKLNQALKRQNWLTTEVRVEIVANEFFREPWNAYSKHNLIMGLSSKDREMKQTAKNNWIHFRLVDLLEYRQINSGNPGVPTRRLAQQDR